MNLILCDCFKIRVIKISKLLYERQKHNLTTKLLTDLESAHSGDSNDGTISPQLNEKFTCRAYAIPNFKENVKFCIRVENESDFMRLLCSRYNPKYFKITV